LALLLAATTTLTQVQAFGIALAIGVALAGLLSGIGLYVLRQRSNLFERSRAEWQQNLRWAKDALAKVSRSSHSPPASR
jgi:predicted RND superfamily exporter protein